MSRPGVIRCLLAAVLFGASAPAASVLARDMPALTLAGLLYVGAALAMAPVVVRRPPRLYAVRADWKPVTIAVVAGGALGPVFLVAGLARIDAATASILLNLELVATVVLAATLFREHLGRRVLGGAALVAAAGAVLGVGARCRSRRRRVVDRGGVRVLGARQRCDGAHRAALARSGGARQGHRGRHGERGARTNPGGRRQRIHHRRTGASARWRSAQWATACRSRSG